MSDVLENRLRITASRNTSMLVIVLAGWIFNLYPWWLIDTKAVKRFGFRRWRLTGGLTVHLGLFGIFIQPYRLTCPSCGGKVQREDGADVCVEPGNCVWSRQTP